MTGIALLNGGVIASAWEFRWTQTNGNSGQTSGYVKGSLGSINDRASMFVSSTAEVVASFFLTTSNVYRLRISDSGGSPPDDFFYSVTWIDDSTTYLASLASISTPSSTDKVWQWAEITNPASPDSFILRL